MVRKRILKIAFCSLALSVICLVCSVAFIGTSKVGADITRGEDLFSSEQVSVTGKSSLPLNFKDDKGNNIPCDFDKGKKGVLLSTKRGGAESLINRQFSGDFEMEFRAYSDVSYQPQSQEDFNRHDISITPYASLREMYLRFEDENGQSFTVYITAGEEWNVITPAARVAINGIHAGYHYLNDALVANDTSAKNAQGYFTRIGGTTFCNVARRNNQYTSKDSMPVTVGYDSSTMEIYVLHYGTRTTFDGLRRVVLDLDDRNTNANAFDNFGKYTVTVGFSDVTPSGANLLVYSINGQPLGGENLDADFPGNAYVKAEHNGLLGKKYSLPLPVSCDLRHGITDFSGKVRVFDGNNSKVAVMDSTGKNIVKDGYVEGCYFIPSKSGNYTIRYNVVKNNKEGRNFEIKLKVFDKMPQVDWDIKGDYSQVQENPVVAKNSDFVVLPAEVSTPYMMNSGKMTALVTLKRNGVALKEVDKQKAEKEIQLKLTRTGKYQLIYSIPVSGNVDSVYEIDFEVSDEIPLFEIADKEEKIAYGSDFTLPKVMADFNGSKKRASVVLFAPSGQKVEVKDNVAKIDETGKYILRAYAVYNGKSFSQAFYYDSMQTNDNLFKFKSGSVSCEYGDSGEYFRNKKYGQKMTFKAENDEIICNRVVDLKTLDKTKPMVKLMVLPKEKGELDIWQVTVKLTDIHDKNNSVRIQIFKGSWGNAFAYVKAGATGQIMAGWEMDKVLVNYNTGCPIKFSFSAESIMDTEECVLYYDYDESAIYVDNIKRPGYSYGNMVIDLDDPQCFSEKTLFKGFTTGEVYMSFSVQYMQSTSADILVTEINGVEMGSRYIEDTTPPEIMVDMEGYEKAPLGEVNVPYPIFKASAVDAVFGKSECSVRVYKDYQLSTVEEMAVTDGKFTPLSAGRYTIIYRAEDIGGNRAEKAVNVEVTNALDEYTLDKDIRKNYYLGEYYEKPEITPQGGSGRATLEINLYKDGKKVNLEKFEEKGSYKVEVLFNDFLGREEKRIIDLSVTSCDKPIIYDFSVPAAIINNTDVIFPDFESVSYDENGKKIAVEKSLEVISSKGSKKIYGGKYRPEFLNDEVITLVYRAKDSLSRVTEKQFKVKVLEVKSGNGIAMEKYFSYENITATATENYIAFNVKPSNNCVFVNPVIADNLEVEFTIPQGKNNFDSFKMTLTDSVDGKNSVSIKFVKGQENSGLTTVYIDGERYVVAGDFYNTTSHGICVKFNNSELVFSDVYGRNILGKVNRTDNGEKFSGFSSDRVYISLSADEINGESAIGLVRIGNQYFSSLKFDRVPPQIHVNKRVETEGDINSEFTIPSAIAVDVLSPDTTLKMKLQYGKNVMYEGDITKDYIFIPKEYGKYNITYIAEAGGREEKLRFSFVIKDKTDPVIEIRGEVPKKVKVGDKVNLPDAVVSDNNTKEMTLRLFVFSPDGNSSLLSGNSFVAESKGKYKVVYYTIDEYCNYSYTSFEIIAE